MVEARLQNLKKPLFDSKKTWHWTCSSYHRYWVDTFYQLWWMIPNLSGFSASWTENALFFLRCFDLAIRDWHILKPEEFSIEWRAPACTHTEWPSFCEIFLQTPFYPELPRGLRPQRETREFSVCLCVRVLYLWFFRIFVSKKNDPNFVPLALKSRGFLCRSST